MGDTRRRTLPVILPILAALAVGFAAPASAGFTTLAPNQPTPPARPSLTASVETPIASLGTGLSWSRTPTGSRPYFGARYYGSKIGRFTSIDPVLDPRAALANPQRWNRYAYVTNNPLWFVDPGPMRRMLMAVAASRMLPTPSNAAAIRHFHLDGEPDAPQSFTSTHTLGRGTGFCCAATVFL